MPGFPHAMPMHGLVGGLLLGLATEFRDRVAFR